MTTTSKELTLPERAAVALKTKAHEIRLHELVTASVNIVAVKNKDGREECHAAYMRLKNARCEISNLATDATEDAKKFTKAVSAEEKRLIEITTKEEDRLKLLRDDWDAAEQARKDALIAAERTRQDAIKARIHAIRILLLTGGSSATIKTSLDMVGNIDIDDSFGEFKEEAITARQDVYDALTAAFDSAVASEVEAARIEQERIDAAAKLKAEQEALAKAQAELKAATELANAELKKQREDQERLNKIAQEKIEAERKESVRLAKVESDRVAAEADDRACKQKIEDDERAEQVRKLEFENARLREAQATLEQQQAALIAANAPPTTTSEFEIEQVYVATIGSGHEIESLVGTVVTLKEAPQADDPLTTPEYRPSAKDIVHALEQLYEEPRKVIIKWLIESNFSEVKE